MELLMWLVGEALVVEKMAVLKNHQETAPEAEMPTEKGK